MVQCTYQLGTGKKNLNCDVFQFILANSKDPNEMQQSVSFCGISSGSSLLVNVPIYQSPLILTALLHIDLINIAYLYHIIMTLT